MLNDSAEIVLWLLKDKVRASCDTNMQRSERWVLLELGFTIDAMPYHPIYAIMQCKKVVELGIEVDGLKKN
ncbi:unnamed protein product [Rhodiola kirilowii]